MYPVYATRLDVRSRDTAETLSAFRDRLEATLEEWSDEALAGCMLRRDAGDSASTAMLTQHQVLDGAGRRVGTAKRLCDVTGGEYPLVWAWAARFEHDHDDAGTSRFSVQARIADGGMSASLTAEHTIAGDRFAPNGQASSLLDLVKRLSIGFEASCGPTPVSRSTWIVGASQVPALITRIRDPARIMPIMVVTRDPAGRTLVDLSVAGPALLGAARIAVLEDGNATWAFREQLGGQWNCFGGAVRIFSSPFHDVDGPERHRLYHPSWFDMPKGSADSDREARLVADARAAFAYLIREDREVEAAFAWYEREAIREQLSAIAKAEPDVPQHDPTTDQWETLRDALNRLADAQDEAARFRAERDDLKSELAEARQNLNKLRLQLDAYTAGIMTDDELPIEENPFEPKPGQLHDIVAEAQKRFDGSHMVILDCALDSARKVQVKDMADAWQKLAHLVEIARLWHNKSLRTSLKAEFEKRGLTYAEKVSSATMGKNKSAYTVSFPPGSSNRLVLGPHIRLNHEDRIYWHQHEELRMFIVGHIGDHLPDSTT